MFPSNHRLPRPQFVVLRRIGKKIHHPLFSIVYTPSPSQNSRAGIIVSAKVVPSAVSRNLLKRRLRSAVSVIFPKLNPPLDFIIIAKPASLHTSVSLLTQSLNQAFE